MFKFYPGYGWSSLDLLKDSLSKTQLYFALLVLSSDICWKSDNDTSSLLGSFFVSKHIWVKSWFILQCSSVCKCELGNLSLSRGNNYINFLIDALWFLLSKKIILKENNHSKSFFKVWYYKKLHVWADLNGPKATRDRGGYSFYTRLICCQEIQKITFGAWSFRWEDYEGEFYICLWAKLTIFIGSNW